MNEQNYASLEMSRKLVEAGIVLETEKSWGFRDGIWTLFETEGIELEEVKQSIPAPMMSELLRELPDGVVVEPGKTTYCRIETIYGVSLIEAFNDNPCDALAELLLWVRKEKI